jgi:bifunctional non-homologous end joining protein LigD
MAAVAKARERVWHSDREDPPPTGARASPVDASKIPDARRAKLPAAVAPQLATPATMARDGDGWLHEIKFDGYRMIARMARNRATLFSRNGKDWSDKFPSVAAALAALELGDAVLDGEIVHLLPTGSAPSRRCSRIYRQPTRATSSTFSSISSILMDIR